MNYLTRTDLIPAGSRDARYNVNKFKSLASVGVSDEILICRRRNMSWTQTFVAAKVGVLTTKAHGGYAHDADSPREKANNRKDCFHAGAGIVLDGKRSHSEEVHETCFANSHRNGGSTIRTRTAPPGEEIISSHRRRVCSCSCIRSICGVPLSGAAELGRTRSTVPSAASAHAFDVRAAGNGESP
jgi:hypothetical protein